MGKFNQTALEHAKQTLALQKQNRINDYYNHPKLCLYCGKVISYEKHNCSKFCSKSCAAKFNNKSRIESGWKPSEEQCKKTSNTLKQYYSTHKHSTHKHKLTIIKHCKWCGAIKGQCKRPDICKHHQMIKSMIKYFGFDNATIGTEKLYEEFEKCRNLLIEEYWDNNLSLSKIADKYSYPDAGTLGQFFKNLQIVTRNRIDAIIKANIVSNRYHCGYHIDWQNNKWFFRSSYEEKQMIEYDSQKINYQVESLRILYYDDVLCRQRVAIPDFYLPDTNEIIEIKSSYTYNEQNMKNKFKAYIKHGYNPKLILNFKETKVNLDN